MDIKAAGEGHDGFVRNHAAQCGHLMDDRIEVGSNWRRNAAVHRQSVLLIGTGIICIGFVGGGWCGRRIMIGVCEELRRSGGSSH